MTKIIGLLVIGVIFLVAWVITKKNKDVQKPDRDKFVEKPHAVEVIPEEKKRTKVSMISRRIFRRVYPTLPRREYYRKKYEIRKWKHNQRVADYEKLGITWTPFGLYWSTHQLAVEHMSNR